MHEASVNTYSTRTVSEVRIFLLSVRAFICGGILVALCIVLASSIPAVRVLFDANTLAPLTEEALKYISVLLVLSSVEMSAAVLMYVAPWVGIGFGFFELARHYQVYGVLGFGALAAHCILALVMTLLLYRAYRGGYTRHYAYALIVPVLLHSAYNVLVVPYFFG
jgi:hypothetical protein